MGYTYSIARLENSLVSLRIKSYHLLMPSKSRWESIAKAISIGCARVPAKSNYQLFRPCELMHLGVNYSPVFVTIVSLSYAQILHSFLCSSVVSEVQDDFWYLWAT